MNNPSLVLTAALHARLSGVSPEFASPEAVRAALAEGRSCLATHPAGLLLDVAERARVNPPLGTALALGAYEALGAHADRVTRACIEAALGIGLGLWGSPAEAFDLLRTARPHLHTPGDEIPGLVTHWYEIACMRRVKSPGGTAEAMLAIASALDAAGAPVLALRCRLDVSQFWYGPAHDKRPELAASLREAFAGLGLPADEGYAALAQAASAAERGDYERAFRLVDEAEALFEVAGALALRCVAWQQRGAFYRQHLDATQALHWLEAADRLAAGVQHPLYRILALVEMAVLQFERGHMEKHFEVMRELEQLEPVMRLPALTAFCQLTTANNLLRHAEYDRAQDAYLAARAQYAALGDTRFAAICTINLGILTRRQGQFSRALRYLHEALQYARETGNFEEELSAYRNLGMTYNAFGYVEPALEYLEHSVEMAQRRGVTIQSARQAIYLALLLAMNGDGQRARELLDLMCHRIRAGNIDHIVALCDAIEGEILVGEKRYRAALRQFYAALERFDALGEDEWGWFMQVKIAEVHLKRGDVSEAEAVLHQIPVERLTAMFQWHHRSLLAGVAEAQGRLTEALTAYVDSLLQVHASRRFLEEEQQAQQFVLSFESLYDRAFNLALDLDNPAEALLIAELHGSQLLTTRLGLHTSGINPRTVPAFLRGALADHLGTDWTVLRYAYHDGQYTLFKLHPEGFDVIPLHLDARARMALRIAATPGESFRRRAYQDGRGKGIGPDGRRHLFEALLPPPARQHLHPDHTLIVVPTGPLHGLAFHALLDGDDPLITRARVLYAQSLELLYHLLARAPVSGNGLGEGLVLAQSQFEQAEYTDLPHVEREVSAVLGGARGTRLPAADMHPERLSHKGRSGEFAAYDWLHFATHAYAEPATGAFTGLLVGPGMLDVQAIGRWKLAARLVTLSACQTGVGRWHYGDEIAGLTQAFISAGAQSVVASLWLVQDESTASLMADFYCALGEGLSPAAALAAAQRAAHRAGVDAYHWAPFSAFGRP